MANEFNIKNGFISQSNSIVNGSLTAKTFYGDGQFLTGISSSFSGGTISGNTIFISGVTGNTFNISSIPVNNDGNAQILTRNSTTGSVEYRNVSSITGSGVQINDIFSYQFLLMGA